MDKRQIRFLWAVGVVLIVGWMPARAAAQISGPDDTVPPPTPRLSDGTVDLGGKGYWDLKRIVNFAAPIEGKPEIEVPFQPWAKALYDYQVSRGLKYDPEGFCLPPGPAPRAMAVPYPAQIIQQPELERMLIIFEGGAHVWREIYMDGRPHPDGDALNPTYFGHSVGHWEGDTLVIDTVGYNEKTWIDIAGHPHTQMLRTIERITRPNYLTMHYEATFDDPGAYTEPWTTAFDISFTPGGELQEYICQENNKWLIDMKDDFGEPFFGRTPGAGN